MIIPIKPGRLIVITKTHKDCDHNDMHDDHDHSNNYEEYKSEDYNAYIEKHGYHFTDKLAEMAISKMVNAEDDKKHGRWTIKQVDTAISTINPQKSFKHKVTPGDLAYAANMYYADFAPNILSEQNCIKAAIALANDPDGYEGQIFSRWIADAMMKNWDIDWKQYI